MKLLVDVGNTRIKWATHADGELTDMDSFVHAGDPVAAADALLARFTTAPDIVLVANVAGPAFDAALSDGIRARWNLDARFATSQKAAGRVRNAYRDVTKLGVDRWLAVLAAADRYPGATCVVDAGTAVTIDLVDAGGAHLGGYIVPGLDLMWSALTEDTGNLGRFTAGDDVGRPETPAPGRDTGEAIGHGSLAAICALIERCAGGLAAHNRDVVVVVTGGDAGRIVPHLAVDLEYRPQLVLEGLVLWEPG